MKFFNHTFLLRLGLSITMLAHSLPGMFNGGVNAFGNLYLDEIGFAPIGLYLAWAIKLSHVATAVSLLTEKFVLLFGWISIAILAMGIVLVHWPDGWFVVGGGRNGMEFNVLLILVFLSVMYGGKRREA